MRNTILISCFFLALSACDSSITESSNQLENLDLSNTNPKHRAEISQNPDYAQALAGLKNQLDATSIISPIHDLASLDDKYPGIAGFYYNAPGGNYKGDFDTVEEALVYAQSLIPIVVFKGITALDESISSRIREDIGKIYNLINDMPIEVRSAKYSALELQEWFQRIAPNSAIQSIGIDHELNKIRVGLGLLSGREQVEQQMENAGVPKDAFLISEIETSIPLRSISYPGSCVGGNNLKNECRPLVGGLRVQAGGQCSLGFIAYNNTPPWHPGPYGVTNTHCSHVIASLDFGYLYQKSITPIGIEAFDPSFFTFFGDDARFSDASIYKLSNDIINNNDFLNDVAIPPGIGQITFNDVLNVIGEGNPAQYSPIMMVGQTSGLRIGWVTDSCEYVYSSIDNFWRICSIESSYMAASGDSGSPVFWPNGSNSDDIIMYGIIWGGNSSNTQSSKLSYIQAETGLDLDLVF